MKGASARWEVGWGCSAPLPQVVGSRHLFTWTVFSQGCSVPTGQWPWCSWGPGAVITVTSRWPAPQPQAPPPPEQKLGGHPSSPARLSCWPSKFSRCFEPKMGRLVLCPRLVQVCQWGGQHLGNRGHPPECWHANGWLLFHFSLPTPSGQCYSKHLAFCFGLIVNQTDITESALDTTVLRQC